MKAIRLYHHPECGRCARIARIDRALDWLNRLEVSTAVPPGGPLRMGQIAVEDLHTGKTVRNVEAVAQLTNHLPAYWPLKLLLCFGWFRRSLDRQMNSCDGGSCRVG